MRPVKGKNRGRRLSQDLIHMEEQTIYKEILRYMYTEVDQGDVPYFVLCTVLILGHPFDNQHAWSPHPSTVDEAWYWPQHVLHSG